MNILQFIVDKEFLAHGVIFHLNHVTYTFIYHQFLMRFQVLLIFRYLSDELIYIRFLLALVLSDKHMFG
jgi:hypothetical protein